MLRLWFLFSIFAVKSSTSSVTQTQEGTDLIKKRVYLMPGGDSVFEINQKKNVAQNKYQGDIELTEQQSLSLEPETRQTASRTRRQAMTDATYPMSLWNRVVYYYYDSSATPKVIHAFNAATGIWGSLTCINFTQSTTAKDRIKVTRGEGCFSSIGRVGGVQELSLGEGCESTGTAAHELGHALGFLHTQSRVDRDGFIEVLPQNLVPGYSSILNKATSASNYNYGIPYDYGSIMQYASTSASSNGQPTMRSKIHIWQDTMGSNIVSFYDILMMNSHYKCHSACPLATRAKCKNGGFAHPRDCSRCICPSGFGGLLCERKPLTCGAYYAAKATYRIMNDTIGDGKAGLYPGVKRCYYWITAPAGQTIEIKIGRLDAIYVDGCIYGGVEIKSQPDLRQTGFRFCSPADQGIVLRSYTNVVPIITFNRFKTNFVRLAYRVVPRSRVEMKKRAKGKHHHQNRRNSTSNASTLV